MQSRKRARFLTLTAAFAAAVLAVLAVITHVSAQEPAAEPPAADQPAAQPQGPQRLPIRGTSVTLTAPPGFTPSRSERGIENTTTGTTVTISEASAEAYPGLADRFKSAKAMTDGYANQGVTIRTVRNVDGKIPFAIGRQTKDGKDLTRYLALLKGDKTVLVSFTSPDRNFTEADAEAILRSVELTPEPTLEERLAQLPFVFRAVEPYVVQNVINRQAVNLEVKNDKTQPTVTIGTGRSQALMGEEARRMPIGREAWGATRLVLPDGAGSARWRDLLTDQVVAVEEVDGRPTLLLGDVLQFLPISLLVAESTG